LHVEEHFGIDIADDRTAGVHNVGDLARLVHELLQPKGDSHSEDQVFEELRPIVAAYAGIKPHQVLRASRFIDDLHFN
jgi:hypothetical protein